MEDQRPYAVGLKEALNSGEKILWAGAPPARVLFHERDYIAIPLAVIWILFAAWMARTAAALAGPEAFCFIVFTAVGGLMLLPGRLILDAMRRSRTAYALTDRQLLILSTFPFRTIIYLPLEKTKLSQTSEANDQSATIELAVPTGFVPSGYLPVRVIGFSLSPPLRLEAVPQARHVYNKILAAQAALEQAG